MSTIALRCPYCGEWLRVAAQPSLIERVGPMDDSRQLLIKFDEQHIAHICKRNRDTDT